MCIPGGGGSLAFFFWLQPSLTSTVPLRLLDILAERGAAAASWPQDLTRGRAVVQARNPKALSVAVEPRPFLVSSKVDRLFVPYFTQYRKS